MTRVLSWALVPTVLVVGLWVTVRLLAAGLSSFVVTGVMVAVCAVTIAILEQLTPERADWVAWDQPLRVDAAHYVFSYHLGIVLGYGASYALSGALKTPLRHLWPAQLPLVLQVLIAALLSEFFGYWQHRAAHRFEWLWRFHALHHSGAHLNLVRAVRFHFVDVGTATFLSFAPLVLLGAPDSVIAIFSVLSGLNGVLNHGNVRMRTPRWLDRLFCTPAVHRHHHSSDLAESNENFGTTLVLFDQLFGTFRTPKADTPAVAGIADDPTPAGFGAQWLAPFRRR